MEIKLKKEERAYAIKLTAEEGGKIFGHAYLYILYNDLHEEAFGLMEDVYVEKGRRGEGVGTRLVDAVIKEARERGCYKLLGQSRYSKEDVHKLYIKLGFKDHGKNFRMDLSL